MKTFWKVLGAAALAVGLTPYKVEKNEETGENSYQALLWRITSEPGKTEGEKRQIDINLGEGSLTSKLWDMIEKKEEPHLFSDELCVEYTGAPVTEQPEAPAEPAEPAEAAAPAEPAAPVEPAAPAEPVEPEEPAEGPAEEEKA